MSLKETYQLVRGETQVKAESLSGSALVSLQNEIESAEKIVSGANVACRNYLRKLETKDTSFLGQQRAAAQRLSQEDRENFVNTKFNKLVSSNVLEGSDLVNAAIAAATEIFETEIGIKPEVRKPL